jgi:hypothetical protein
MATKNNNTPLGDALKALTNIETKNKISKIASSEQIEIAKKEIQAAIDEKKKTSLINPYFRARIKILIKYPEWRRNEISALEKAGDLDNRHYLDFVKEVAAEGDKLSLDKPTN